MDHPARLSAYLERRGLGPGEPRGDEVVAALRRDGRGAHRLEAAFRPVGARGDHLLIRVRTDQRLPGEVRDEVLASCNVWNARTRLPRAWLDASGPAGAGEGEVVLDGCAPRAALPTQLALDGFADAVLAGAERFWRWADLNAGW